MDLDLNCSPPSPETAAQVDLNSPMPRYQVKDLHRLYWAPTNRTSVPPPFWKQSHPSHMVNFDESSVISHCYRQAKQGFRHDYREAAGDSLDVKEPDRRQPDPRDAQGMKSNYQYVIDLEQPATLEEEVGIVSSRYFNYGTCNGFSLDNSQSVPPESSPVIGNLCTDHSIPYASHGSPGSSDTPGSNSPVRAKTTVSGRMLFDLNVAQEDDSNICPDSSKVLCSILASSATRISGGCCNDPSKIFSKGSESSIGSSKESCVTVATTISAPDGVKEATTAGLFCDSQSDMPFCVETSKYNALISGKTHHQQSLHTNSGLDFQGCMKIPRISAVSPSGGNKSSSGISKLGGSQATSLTGQLPVAMHREAQEDTITVISDSEMEIFDLNVPVESVDLPSKVDANYAWKPVNSHENEESYCVHYSTQDEGRQNISLAECLTSRSYHMAENKDNEDVQSPGSGIVINRSLLIPETPEGHDYACPRLSSSSNEVSIKLETVCIHQAKLGEDETSAAAAAETLVSIFATNSAWTTDSHGSNSQTDPPDTDRNHKPLLSLDSFEASILNLEEMKDDGESTPLRPPDKDIQSCGVKLKRGRRMRDFQSEILPGLVSLARHEICDDLHAIEYEIRKGQSRRSSGEQGTPPMRTRLPRRCSTAWNR